MPNKNITKCPKCSGATLFVVETMGWRGSFDDEGVLQCFNKTNEIEAVICENKNCLYEFNESEIERTTCSFN